jgi:hypothetical protein
VIICVSTGQFYVQTNIDFECLRGKYIPFAVLHLDDRVHEYVVQASERALAFGRCSTRVALVG